MSYYDSSEDSFEDFLEWRRFKKERRQHQRKARERQLMGLTEGPSEFVQGARGAIQSGVTTASRSVGGVGNTLQSASRSVAATASRALGKAEEVEVGAEALGGKSFQEKLSQASNKGALRKQLTAQVNAVLNAGAYTTSDGSVVELSQSAIAASRDNTVVYTGSESWPEFPNNFATTAHFVKADAIETALFLVDRKSVNPVVLVSADPTLLGGGFKGNSSLEEQIFRRTTVATALDADNYRIPQGGAIYVPKVQVFRDSEQKSGYAWFKEPREISLILASSVRNPNYETVRNGIIELEKSAAEQTTATLRTVLRAALKAKHDAIVLTAFGCGYNGNPPQAVASIFRTLLTGEFSNCFKHVTFAIIEDENSNKSHNPSGNVRSFQSEFLTVRVQKGQGCC